MGSLCSGSCQSESIKLRTPFGSLICSKSACGCLKVSTQKTDEQLAETAMNHAINDAIKAEMAVIEAAMRASIIAHIHEHGTLPPIHVLSQGVMSPPAQSRSLTIRVAHTDDRLMREIDTLD